MHTASKRDEVMTSPSTFQMQVAELQSVGINVIYYMASFPSLLDETNFVLII